MLAAQSVLRPVQPVRQILLLEIAVAEHLTAALAVGPLVQQQQVVAMLARQPHPGQKIRGAILSKAGNVDDGGVAALVIEVAVQVDAVLGGDGDLVAEPGGR